MAAVAPHVIACRRGRVVRSEFAHRDASLPRAAGVRSCGDMPKRIVIGRPAARSAEIAGESTLSGTGRAVDETRSPTPRPTRAALTSGRSSAGRDHLDSLLQAPRPHQRQVDRCRPKPARPRAAIRTSRPQQVQQGLRLRSPTPMMRSTSLLRRRHPQLPTARVTTPRATPPRGSRRARPNWNRFATHHWQKQPSAPNFGA